MNRRLCRSSLVPLAFAFAVTGCNPPTPVAPPPSANPGRGTGTTAGSTGPMTPQQRAGGPHIMPLHHPDRAKPVAHPNAGFANLQYYGGPVLSNVKVYTVFWNSQVQYQSQLNAFYTAVTNSAYFDWLNEYNTPTQTLGRGSLIGSLVDPSPPASTALTNVDIQNELAKLIDNGTVPAPTADTLYMVHFPPGVSIDLDGQGSCVVFCAYHNTFVHNGVNVYYGVMPDQGGGCAGGCGGDPVQFNNLTSVSSHELIEAVTDAAVGLATAVGPPLAWYDTNYGEIGDICNGQQGTVAGYTVQTEYSNKAGACIVTAGSCTPDCTGKACGDDGCGGSCGSCPSGQTCDASGQCQAGCTPQCTGKACGDDGCGGSCGSCPSGQTCTADGQCQGTVTCAHDDCTTGSALANGCDACVTSICGVDPYCCTTAWDSICVGEVGSVCGKTCGGPTCAHDECKVGANLDSGCDACVTSICAVDAYCCSTSWDRLCVNEVGSVCGKSCGSTCSHAICTTGSNLTNGCDPCVTKICATDSYCCSTAWDSICVGEVGSICGQSCQ